MLGEVDGIVGVARREESAQSPTASRTSNTSTTTQIPK